MSSSDGQGLAPRAAAWRVLQAVAAGAWADAALERELARHPLPPADRALATELAYGAVRQRRVLDGWIDALGRVSAERQPPKLRWLLHVGIYQLLFSQRVPPAAAVNTTVELARQGGLGRLGPVVNGLLRALLRRRHDLPAGAEPWQGLTLPADPVQTFALLLAAAGAGRGLRPGRQQPSGPRSAGEPLSRQPGGGAGGLHRRRRGGRCSAPGP